ncbi:MAG: hypothetical protein WBF73_24925 [Bradyrhizobium sp.]
MARSPVNFKSMLGAIANSAPKAGHFHRCRVIWTHHGPRRVCRWHHRHRRHHWRGYW